MKSTFLVLILLLSGCVFLSAQIVDRPFPTENAYWQINLGCIESFDRNTYTCGDTVLNGKKYAQLYTEFLFAGNGTIIPRGWIRRQDHQVYFRENLDSEEFLIYDFDLQQNDTVRLMRRVTDFADTSVVITDLLFEVETIDSVLLADGWRKRWRVNCQNFDLPQEIWIEGIGSTFGPVDRFNCFLGGIAKVYCFWHNGQVEYTLFPQGSCGANFPTACLITVNTSQPMFRPLNVAVSPNPFSDHLKVSFLDGIPTSAEIRLFDITGREDLFFHKKMILPFYLNAVAFHRGSIFWK